VEHVQALFAVPAAAGLLCLLIPSVVKGVREGLAVVASGVALYLAWAAWSSGEATWTLLGSPWLAMRLDALSGLIVMGCAFFAVAVSVYSIGYMRGRPRLGEYYCYLLWTLSASVAAALADSLWLLAVCWGFLGLTLYLLVGIGGPRSAAAAKKTFIVVGGSDAAMLLGIVMACHLTGSCALFRDGGSRLALSGGMAVASYLLILSGVLSKAGALPLHTWVPDAAETAPASVAAYLPASLDKLLGVYLLARVSLNLYRLGPGMAVALMLIGAATILVSVMMALVQHDAKRLLGYHAVSQVGYMVLGIGTLNPLGVMGGLFHMLNHAIYKSSLFLGAGSVERQAGTTDLDRLGGLGRAMPITFAAFLVGALAISGVPPLNGFASKWLVYQGVVELADGGTRLWPLLLVAATLGSALTLASFVKLLHAVFLGPRTERDESAVREAPASMWIPHVVLALLCIVFGVAARALPLQRLIAPAAGVDALPDLAWTSGLATLLIVLGLAVGGLILLIGRPSKVRVDSTFVGGEVMRPEMRPTGVDFYDTLSSSRPLKGLYSWAAKGAFDLYKVGSGLALYFTAGLRALHRGLLPTYVLWCIAGLVALALILVRLP